jgi:hypothetical protein
MKTPKQTAKPTSPVTPQGNQATPKVIISEAPTAPPPAVATEESAAVMGISAKTLAEMRKGASVVAKYAARAPAMEAARPLAPEPVFVERDPNVIPGFQTPGKAVDPEAGPVNPQTLVTPK